MASLMTRLEKEAASERSRAEAALAMGDFDGAMGNLGNEQRADMLWKWWSEGEIDREGLRCMILHAWDHGPRAGYIVLGEVRWITLFRAAGFVSDDGSARPTEAMTVWRGAPTWTEGRGFSWSLSRERAIWFRDRWILRRVTASIYRTHIVPRQILALDRNNRGEAEVVVNPRALRGRHAPQEEERLMPASASELVTG